jgi:hypothetical protein
MNKIFKSILFLLLPVTSFCHEGDSVRADKFQFGIIYSPEYCYRTLKTNAENNWLKEAADDLETAKFGYSTGISFGCKLSNKLMFEAEVLYADKGSKTKKNTFENNVSIAASEKIPHKSILIYHYQYIDVPLKLNYYFVNKKIDFFVSAGVSVNIFLNHQNEMLIEYKDGSSKKFNSNSTAGVDKINLAALVGFGINYDFSDRCILKLEPVFNHSLTPLANSPVKNYFYSLGINMGIAYRF